MKAVVVPEVRRRPRWLADGLALAGVWLLILLFLGRALLPGQVLLPLDIVTQQWPPWQQPDQPAVVHNLLISDVVNYIFPVKQFAAEAVRAGVLPLWNPYVLTGYPFTYNTQAGLFYPLSLLYYLLPVAAAVDATILLQMGLGGLFMYLYLRQICLRRPAAVAGAIIFLFNGLMVVWLEWQVVHAAIIWLPLSLYFIERLVTALSSDRHHAPTAWRQALYAGIAFAIPWLGGHWNWTLYGSLTTAAYLVARLAGAKIPARRVVLYTAVVLGLGTALSLVQVLPALNYLRQSHRQPLPFADLLNFGLLNRAVVFFVPNFFGDPINRNWWGYDNYAETTLYLGILPLCLSLLALRLRRTWHTWFFSLWGLLGLLWTLGTPVYGLLYLLPVFDGLLPSRAAVLVVFAGAVLAALALDSLLAAQPTIAVHRWGMGVLLLMLLLTAGYALSYRSDVARTWHDLRSSFALFLLWLGGSAGLLLAYSRGRLSPPRFAWLSLLWLTADLVVFGYGYNPVRPVTELYPPTNTGNFLQAEGQRELFRVVTPPAHVTFPPNTTLVLPIANLSGYEPGIDRRLVNYVNFAEAGYAVYSTRSLIPQQAVTSPLLDVLNVKYLVTIEDRWDSSDSRPAWEKPAVVAWRPLPVEVPFMLPDAGLHRVEVPLRAATATAGAITARILSADGGYEFAHAERPAADLADNEWQGFDFGAFPSEWGRAFRLRLEGEGQVGLTDAGEPAFVPAYLPRPGLVHEDGKTRIYENEGYLPRAFAVHRAMVVADETAALLALRDHAAELDQVVMLELEGEGDQFSVFRDQFSVTGDHFSAEVVGRSPVVVSEYGLNRVVLRATMAAPGFVVLADAYYPGWQATVDGVRVPIYRANSVLRAVPVPAGEHEIVFVFRPFDFILGAVISGLALLAGTAVILWTYRRRASL